MHSITADPDPMAGLHATMAQALAPHVHAQQLLQPRALLAGAGPLRLHVRALALPRPLARLPRRAEAPACRAADRRPRWRHLALDRAAGLLRRGAVVMDALRNLLNDAFVVLVLGGGCLGLLIVVAIVIKAAAELIDGDDDWEN